MTDYKPGTIAKATVRGVPDVTVMRTDDAGSAEFTALVWLTPQHFSGHRHHFASHVTNVRPLVVLDLDSPRSVVEAFRNLRTALREGHVLPLFIEQVLDQIEAQTRPAIEEPKGLGAVVESDDALWWVRNSGGIDGFVWQSGNAKRRWADVKAVRILSPGVEP